MKNSRALGAWALVCAIVAPVWLIGGFYAAVMTQATTVSPVIQVIAAIALFGWFVVPLAVLGALGLGIAAIATRRGRALGVAALVALAVGGSRGAGTRRRLVRWNRRLPRDDVLLTRDTPCSVGGN